VFSKTGLANVERVSQVGFKVPYKVINTAQHTDEVIREQCNSRGSKPAYNLRVLALWKAEDAAFKAVPLMMMRRRRRRKKKGRRKKTKKMRRRTKRRRRRRRSWRKRMSRQRSNRWGRGSNSPDNIRAKRRGARGNSDQPLATFASK
jgi:hypothetical protein